LRRTRRTVRKSRPRRPQPRRNARSRTRYRARTVRHVPSRSRCSRTRRIRYARNGKPVTELVALDVGGTHARFAFASIDPNGSISVGEPVTLKTDDYASLQT